MSFIYNYFFNDNSTPSERENAAAFKTMINDRKTTLKSEYKQYESEYKQAIKDAEATYKRTKEQAKEDMERKTLAAVQREVDILLKTDEFANSDAKTKAKVESFVSWMNNASKSCGHVGGDGSDAGGVDEKSATFVEEKQLELIQV